MYFTHCLAGAVTSKIVIERKKDILSKAEENILWFVGITASLFPDFDLILFLFHFPNVVNHRDWISHSIVLYFFASAVLYTVGFLSKKREKYGRQFFMTLAQVFVIGILTHLVLDFFVGGLKMLLPFSRATYGFPMDSLKDTNWIYAYVKSPYMFIEALVLLVFLKVFRAYKNKFAKYLSYFYFTIAVLTVGIVGIFVI